MPLLHKTLMVLLWLMPGGLLIGPAVLLWTHYQQRKPESLPDNAVLQQPQ